MTQGITVEEATVLADDEPCFSMMSLTTLLEVEKKYPPPLSIEKQQELLEEISDQEVIPFDDVIEIEAEFIRTECILADIDFEFVVDSSGSIGSDNWETTMRLIGEEWIKNVIVPNGAKQCGNHVAGRWFSSSSDRFFDFEPPAKSVYAPATFAEFAADSFINQTYHSGGTNTAYALEQTRLVDLPLARNGLKYVMVFTDGESNNFSQTSAEAKLLHEVANRTYAYGIGSGIIMDELKAIASKESYVGTMTNFDELEEIIRNFVIIQQGCKTVNAQPHRGVNLRNQTIGMSHQTASQLTTKIDPQCELSTSCPTEEDSRMPICANCCAEIGMISKISNIKS